MRHPGTPDLIRYARGEADGLRAHVETCPRCAAEVEKLHAGFAALRVIARGANDPGSDCLGDHEIATVAESGVEGGRGLAQVAHLSTCVRCRTAVSGVAAALASEGVSTELRELEPVHRPRRVRHLLRAGVAAAAVLLLFLQPTPMSEPTVHRERPVTAAPAPVPLSPVGSVSEALALRWRSVPGADRYRVTVFAAEIGAVHEAFSADTVAELPESIGLERGRTYYWTVAARTGFDRWVTSDLAEFTLSGPAR